MGIILDSMQMEACHPDDKITATRELLDSFTNHQSVHLVEFLSLVGTLQFACKAVVPGRIFLQRMINLNKVVPSRFHHIKLNREFFKDLNMCKSVFSWLERLFLLS